MNLLPHQQQGVTIAETRPRFAFGWKPGVGKTILSLAVCAARPMKTVVLCPKSILWSAWKADSCHFPAIRTKVVHGGTAASRRHEIMANDWDVVVTTYETWRRHKDDYLLAGVQRLIVDESSKCRNPEAKITNALILFSDKMAEVYLLSGTMAPNNVTEYWAQIRALAGRSFPSFWQFAYRYATPVKKRRWGRDCRTGQPKQVEYIATWVQNESQRTALQKLLEQWCWFLRKEDCLDLPPQTDHVIEVELSETERTVYDEAAEEFSINGNQLAQQAVLMKLRQITGGMVLVEGDVSEIGTSKLDALMELLEEIGPDEPVVVWAEFAHEIDAIVRLVEASNRTVAVVDGRTSGKAGDTAARFQAGSINVLVCHPAAAGHGITLTRAAYCVYFSMSFSAEQYEQSRNRIHRVGQDRACTYYHLLALGSADKKGDRDTVDHSCHAVSRGKMKASAAMEKEVERARKRRVTA